MLAPLPAAESWNAPGRGEDNDDDDDDEEDEEEEKKEEEEGLFMKEPMRSFLAMALTVFSSIRFDLDTFGGGRGAERVALARQGARA